MERIGWEDVALFLAVVRGGSLAAAGRTLRVEPSTVSRRLAALEERAGLQLFERTRDGLVPNEQAEALIEAAEEAEAGVLRFRRDAQALDREVAGEVRVSAPPGVVDAFLVPFAARLRARHPRISLALSPSTAVADLSRREADLALRVVRPERGDLVRKRVLGIRYDVVAAPALAARLGTLAAWGDAPWVAAPEGAAPPPVERFLAAALAEVEPVLRAGSMVTLLRAVEAGLGVAVAPTIYVAARDLVRLPLAPAMRAQLDALPGGDVYLVGHRALRAVPRIAAVWDALEADIAALAVPDDG